MKVALLDKRLGTHDGHHKDNWVERGGKPREGSMDNENTFAFLNCWDEPVMTGPLEKYTDYSILKDYDLIYMRVRSHLGLHPIMELRKTCPKPILVVYTDEYVNFEKPPNWINEISRYVDAMTCGFGKKYDREIFEELKVDNFYSLPYAGDVHYWKKWHRPWDEKEDYVTGMWHLRSFRGQGRASPRHEWTFKWFKEMQDEFDVGCKFFTNFDGHKHISVLMDEVKKCGIECELIRHIDNPDFNEMLSRSKVFFEEYLCPNYSRATVVSAAVGTPSISTDMNEPSSKCFPDLTVEYPDMGRTFELGRRLLSNEEYWKEQAKSGHENCEYYYYPAYKERLMELYQELLSKRQS